MEHPEDDRQVPSAEVYVTVNDEARGAVSTRRQYLVFVIAIVAALAALLVTSLPSRQVGSRSSAAALSRPAKTAHSTQLPPGAAVSCVDALGYRGLGAPVSDLTGNYAAPHAQPRLMPRRGSYGVTATESGCVIALSVQDGFSARVPARDLLLLVSQPFLPPDAKQVVNIKSCVVWKSAVLRHATGRAYARAAVVPEAGSAAAARDALARSIPARAEIQATSIRTC